MMVYALYAATCGLCELELEIVETLARTLPQSLNADAFEVLPPDLRPSLAFYYDVSKRRTRVRPSSSSRRLLMGAVTQPPTLPIKK